MKVFCSLLLVIFVFTTNSFLQIRKNDSIIAPQTAVVKFSLLDLPGLQNAESKWEVSYELRIISEKEKYEAIKSGKLKQMESEEKIGILIDKGSFTKKDLLDKENRQSSVTILLSEEIRERLRNQPQNRINPAASNYDEASIKKMKEDEAKAQVFLLYANAIVYDGKLKKNVVAPLSRIISFTQCPDASFEMTLKLNNDGFYSSNLILPTSKTSTPVFKTVKNQ